MIDRRETASSDGSEPGKSDDLAIDFLECDKEPIHIPGCIQPHGYVFVFMERDLQIVSVSANIEELIGTQPDTVLGTSLTSHLTDASLERLSAALGRDELAAANPIRIDLRTPTGNRPFNGLLHRHDSLTFLELEPRDDAYSSHDFFRSVRAAIHRLQTASDLLAACDIAAREIHRITGFDRVKVYRFSSDWSGQVIAEHRVDSIPSLLDFHFPSSDIPAQSRALYTINTVRIIPDIGYRASPLVPDHNPMTGGPIDLSYCTLRSVSPTHVEYMVNMAVYGAMSISIVRDNRLWGMISCHNTLPRFVPFETRQACELIAQVLTWQISVLEEAEIVRHSVRVRALQNRLLHELNDEKGLHAGLSRVGEELLSLMNASGFALCGFDGVASFGRTPSQGQIVALARWLARNEPHGVFDTDRLALHHEDAGKYAEIASGVLAVPLGRASTTLMLWFRPEVAQTVTWGGDPHKPVRIGPSGKRLQTRASFDAWREEVRGRALPWRHHEVAAAVEIRDLVVDVILGRAEQLESANRELSRINDELESFAYVAAHDLKEPLRHIEAFAGLLSDLLQPAVDARLGTMVDGIEASSRRLRALINDLAEYSRVGRQGRPMQPVDINEVLSEVLADLKPMLQDTRAVVFSDDLPTLLCDSSQIRQLLQNLITNALKYRDKNRIPELRINCSIEDSKPPDSGAVERRARISVTDNGIGFDEQHCEQVFEPFQRLHGPDQYEGTGIGLAICRKIVNRHGGEINAISQAGVGSVFTFSLPLRGIEGAGDES
jgi:light-regulated signal transduction histidine kinase (bacteriophytochrome)